MDGINCYLQPGRLADVLALIQVLAYDRDTSRTEVGLEEELQRKPAIGKTWIALATQHPEFFRVRADPAKTKRVALLARYVLVYEQLPDGEEKRPSLNVIVVNKLMELAIQLHDKQLERKTRWRTVVIPMSVAIVAAVASMFGAFVIASKPAASPVIQLVAPAVVSPANSTTPPQTAPNAIPVAVQDARGMPMPQSQTIVARD